MATQRESGKSTGRETLLRLAGWTVVALGALAVLESLEPIEAGEALAFLGGAALLAFALTPTSEK